MPSQQILPITHHPQPSSYPFSGSNPSSILPSSSVSAGAMFLNIEDDPTSRLLISSSFEEEKVPFNPINKPILPKVSSYTTTSSSTSTTTGPAKTAKSFYQQQRRRRNASEDSLSSLSDGESRRSLGRDVGHAAAETFLLTRLTLKLLRYLG